jgi:hypothetical protein
LAPNITKEMDIWVYVYPMPPEVNDLFEKVFVIVG